MNTPDLSTEISARPPLRTQLHEAIRYWEGHRLGYNVVLLLVTLGWLVFTWPHFRPALTWASGGIMLVLAASANVCYCAAYPLDLALQQTAWRTTWPRRRWILRVAGTLLAAGLAYYWIADEIYPAVG